MPYERAEYLFKQASLKHASKGWTLHQLRHPGLAHLAEAGINLPLLMAKSGHQNLRSLQRYARPGTEAVAAMTAAHDPAAGDPELNTARNGIRGAGLSREQGQPVTRARHPGVGEFKR